MKQITIVTLAQNGIVADISSKLGEAGINMESIDAFAVRGWDIVQLTVDDYNHALHVLRDAGYDAITEDAVVIHIKDQPGALATVTQRLLTAGIEMRSMRFLHRKDGEALVAISMDRTDDALRLIDDLLVDRGQ